MPIEPDDAIRSLGVVCIATGTLDRDVTWKGNVSRVYQAGEQIPSPLLPWRPSWLIKTIVDVLQAQVERVCTAARDNGAAVVSMKLEVIPAVEMTAKAAGEAMSAWPEEEARRDAAQLKAQHDGAQERDYPKDADVFGRPGNG